MSPQKTFIFLQEVEKVKEKILQRDDLEDIITMYKNIEKTQNNIMIAFFPHVSDREKSKYSRALQDVVKEFLDSAFLVLLRLEKGKYHGTKEEGLAGGGYHKALIEEKGLIEVTKIYTDNAKKGVEAKGIIPRSDEEKEHIIRQKAQNILTNQEIADQCNVLFFDKNQGKRIGNGVAQLYYKYNYKNKKEV